MASGKYAKKIVRKWFKEYQNSDLYKLLFAIYKENTKWTIEFFAEMMAEYMDDPPLYWNGEDVYDLVIHLIPEKSVFSKDIYEGFCPILCSFFEFLGREIIEDDFSKELVESLKGKDHELMKNAKFMIGEN